MDPIWKKLPHDLVRYIISLSELSIDARLAFGIVPKRLDEDKCWRLWYLLKSHDGLVYNLESKSLHNFRIPGHHIIRRPIELSYHTAGLLVFNEAREEHIIEMSCPCGCFTGLTSSERWMTELDVLFKGAAPSRQLGTEDSMLICG